MKSPPAPMTEDDCDDIFGPPRTYPTGYCPPKNRPSMISAKYRQKEERRKVLKISMNKLKKIEDPESSLCRSVLINNTMKRLQQEARDEKIQKQQLNYPRCYDHDNLLNIKSEFIKNEGKPAIDYDDDDHHHHHLHVDFVVENDFDAKLAEEINTMTAKNMEVFSGLVDESNLVSVEQQSHQQQQAMVVCGDSSSDSYSCSSPSATGRKRSFDEMEDCDVQDVLSQFYMPPTPRMLTCIDDDDENDNPKRSKLDETLTTTTTNTFDIKQSTTTPSDVCDVKSTNNTSSSTNPGDFSVNFINNNNNNDSRLRYGNSQSETDSNNSFSCGHASMFNELQNNVYHNLIASLET